MRRKEGVEAQVTLTDLRPNLQAAEQLSGASGVTYRREQVSALAVPHFAGPRPPLRHMTSDRIDEDVIRLTYVPT